MVSETNCFPYFSFTYIHLFFKLQFIKVLLLLSGRKLILYLYIKKVAIQEITDRSLKQVAICCKTIVHIIYSSIFSHHKYNALCKNQHGFQCKRLCESQ